MGDYARDQHLAGRKLDLLPHIPLVLMTHIGRFDGIGAGPHLQDQIDDVLELSVGDMGHVPAAEAGVISDAILGYALQRMIERLDPQLRPLAIALRALLDEMVVHVREHGVVDLQHETGLVDLEILLPQRLRDREHIIPLVGIVLVGGVVADAGRRDRGEEHLLYVRRGGGRSEVVEIAPDAGVALIGDGADAGMSRRADRAARELRGHEIRKPDAVAAQPDCGVELVRPRLEPAQALQAVIGPAGFAELAIVDDVDPRLRLPRYDVRHRALELPLIGAAVRGVAILGGIQQRPGANQAPHMRRQDALLASLHRIGSVRWQRNRAALAYAWDADGR